MMGVYISGTLLGTIFFAILASVFGTLGLFHPSALAMACGVGSGSMMASCSGTLASIFPEAEQEILAFAGASNLLTYGGGLYFCLFITIPVVEALYRWMGPGDEGTATSNGRTTQ